MRPEPDYIGAHTHCSQHREEILSSDVCGCFYSRTTFHPSRIVEWIDEEEGILETALCPNCGIDAVIGSKSGYPITPEFLAKMYRYWFG